MLYTTECSKPRAKGINLRQLKRPRNAALRITPQFELIHPFMDGNGRVGHLLLASTIAEWCDRAHQWLYFSLYFDRNRDRYIELLFRLSSEDCWREWIESCLRGVVEQCNDTPRRCDRLIDLYRTFHDHVNEMDGSTWLSMIVDDLITLPVAIVSA